MFDILLKVCYTDFAKANGYGAFCFVATEPQLDICGQSALSHEDSRPAIRLSNGGNHAGGRFAMVNKRCKQCGNPLTDSTRTFCSMKCYRMSRRKCNDWRLRDDGAIEIVLTREQVAIIDADDLNLVLKYGGWIAQLSRGNYRAVRCPRIDEDNPVYLMPRLIMGASGGEEVDHINHDTLDNRKSNLRLCSHQENMCNSQPKGQSEYKGVYPTDWGTWCAAVTVNGERFYLGSFPSEQDAAAAYNKAAKDKHGEFANLNNL